MLRLYIFPIRHQAISDHAVLKSLWLSTAASSSLIDCFDWPRYRESSNSSEALLSSKARVITRLILCLNSAKWPSLSQLYRIAQDVVSATSEACHK